MCNRSFLLLRFTLVLLEYLSCSYAVILSEKTKPERTCNVARCPINRRQGGVWINFQNENLRTLKFINGAIKLKIGNVWWNRPCLSQKTHLLVCLSVGLAKVDLCNILWNTIHEFGPGEGEIILSKCEKKRFIETRIPNSWCYSTMKPFSSSFQWFSESRCSFIQCARRDTRSRADSKLN